MTPDPCETYVVYTVGCKVNQYDTQQHREALESCGLRPAGPDRVADLALVNTCAVTATAARKSRQLVRRCARGGQTSVIVVGCGVGADRQRFEQIPGVVALIGPEQDLVPTLCRLLGAQSNPRTHKKLSAVPANSSTAVGRVSDGDRDDPRVTSAASTQVGAPSSTGRSLTRSKAPQTGQVKWSLRGTIRRFAGHQRAFLKVQDGCDGGCTYCVIPSLRKTLESKPIEVAVQEAAGLVAAGHREIVVTGICLGAYGRPTTRRACRDESTHPLADLLAALADIPGLLRVRLSSLDPGDVSDELLDVMGRSPAAVPHLHLPLQAGSDDVLKRMNRQYRIADYLATIDRVVAALDRPAITTDVIVGFPGETQDHFKQTLRITMRVKFARVHAFPFSPRAGTAAEKWRDRQLPPDVLRERMQQLQALADRTARDYRRRFIGQTERVIVESTAPGGWRGRSDRYFPIAFPAPAAPDLRGKVAHVTVEAVEDDVVGRLESVE